LRGSVGTRVRTLLMARGVLGERATDFYIAFWIIFAIGVGARYQGFMRWTSGAPDLSCRLPHAGGAEERRCRVSCFDEALAARTRQRTGRPDPSARPVRSRLLS
jgi:hypothetical protein